MSPLSKTTARIISPRKASLEKKANRPSDPLAYTEYVERVTRMVSTTKEDIDGSHRALKRIKLDVDEMRVTSGEGPADPRRSPSPDKALSRTSQRVNPPPLTKEAQARLDEMRQLISKRQMEGTPRIRPYSIVSESPTLLTPDATGNPILSRLEESIKDANLFITRAATSHDMLQDCLEQLFEDLKAKVEEYDRTRTELQNAKRQCELVKSLLVDATAEKEIMYEAFNEELDAMYKDANLPHDEAWQAMTKDLTSTKESRNALSHENSKLKRRIAELDAEKEEAMLQSGRLTP